MAELIQKISDSDQIKGSLSILFGATSVVLLFVSFQINFQ